MLNLDDVREFDSVLKKRIRLYREKLRDWLAPHRLRLQDVRVSRVLIPTNGVYTPGWQALPAISWEYVELITDAGLTGTGEWSIKLGENTRATLDRLKSQPQCNLLDEQYEESLFMAWWDLVGQVLNKPLHLLWSELFERDFSPPDRVPMAAYTWQRFPDQNGNGAVTFDSWPQFAAALARKGFPVVKVSMTAYAPEDHVELLHRIREAVGPETPIRADAHGSWNFQEARRILPALADVQLEYFEQPVNFLLPQRYYPRGERVPARSPAEGGFQSEYYFRRMTELRRSTPIPLSCHWWTPPIVHPPGASEMANLWEPNWYMLERYEGADVSVPDIGLGPWGLWRLTQLAKFLGMHVTVHSNFELCLQLAFRAAMVSGLIYESERAGLYMGTAPRICHAIDNETHQISDDVIEGGQFDWTGGHLKLSPKPGHGLKLDPERLEKYRYTPQAVAAHRAYSKQIYANYLLDRPRRVNQAGWPKQQMSERFDKHAWPYLVTDILGSEETQEIDLELNR